MKQNKTTSHLRHPFVLVNIIVTAYIVSFIGLLQPSLTRADITSTATTPKFNMQIVPPECTEPGGCSVCDIVKIFTNAADLIGIFLSSIALLMFIIGGLLWIFSAGQTDRIERGKKIILGTVTGLAIVFLAWFAVNVIVRVSASSGNSTVGGLGTDTTLFKDSDGAFSWWSLDNCVPKTPTSCKGYSIGTVCGFGDAGCADSEACSCYRPPDPDGDDNLCTGDDATDITGAKFDGKKCYCASQCSRYNLTQAPDYGCVTKENYTGHESNYIKAIGVTCPGETDICATGAF